MEDQVSPYLTLSAVVMSGEKAWAIDGHFRMYAYDGEQFWRRRASSTRYARIPASKAPALGWIHRGGCTCDLCDSIRRTISRAA